MELFLCVTYKLKSTIIAGIVVITMINNNALMQEENDND